MSDNHNDYQNINDYYIENDYYPKYNDEYYNFDETDNYELLLFNISLFFEFINSFCYRLCFKLYLYPNDGPSYVSSKCFVKC